MEYKKTSLLIKEVAKELNNKGVRISDKGVKIVIDSYLAKKKESLENGYTVVEDGIGDLTPAVRRCNTFEEGKTSITAKLTVKVNPTLKAKIKKNMLTEEVFCRLGGTKLSKEEYEKYVSENAK